MTITEDCDLLVHNGIVVTMDGPADQAPTGAVAGRVIHSGGVAVRGCRIVAVDTDAALVRRFRAASVIDAGGGVIHPGFVDAHAHANLHLCRGLVSDQPSVLGGISMDDWYHVVDEADEAIGTRVLGLEMLRNGYTCFAEPGTVFSTDAVAAAAAAVGIRVVLADPYLWDCVPPGEAPPGRMRRVPADTDRALKVLGTELRRNREPDGVAHGYVALNNIGTSSDVLYDAALAAARTGDTAMVLHHNRTPGLAAREDARFGGHALKVLFDTGRLDRHCGFVHMNVVREDEMAAVVDSGMSVLWCPANTMYYGVTAEVPTPMPALLVRGANVTTGIDQAKAWSFGDMELIAYLAARAEGGLITPVQLMWMRTRGAARAVGLAAEVGSLEPGKRADIVVRSSEVPEALPGWNLAQDMLLSVRSRNVETVVTNGQVVWRDGRPTLVEPGEVFAEARTRVIAAMQRGGLKAGPYWPDALG